MRKLLWAGLLAAFALLVPTASAQDGGSVILLGSSSGPPPLSETDVTAELSGELVVAFHGDQATGCVAAGLCGYSGTVIVRPGSSADMALAKYRRRGQISYDVQLILGNGFAGPLVASRVERVVNGTQAGLCADAQQPLAAPSATSDHGLVTLPLFQQHGALLANRCAGPLDGELERNGPTIAASVSELLKGHRRLDLGGTWSFASGGLAGTVSSTLAMSLGKPVKQPTRAIPLPKGVKTQQMRVVRQMLSVTNGGGRFQLNIRGTPNSNVCQPLDACAIQGTLTASVLPRRLSGELSAIGTAARPYADFLAALGASGHGNARGIQVSGTFEVPGGGSLAASFDQGQPCASTASLGARTVTLVRQGDRLFAAYMPVDPLRTRCPGPMLGADETLASGTVGLGAFSRRTFTVQLRGAQPFEDDGYSVTPRGGLTFTVHRGRLSQQVVSFPSG